MIALLDYGAGNLRSVYKAFKYLGADVRVVTAPSGMADARAVVLPGVGAFDDCIQALHRQELLEASRDWIQRGNLFLGICVGYQALFERSTEFNSCAAGLGVLKGSVIRFPDEAGLKVPQIGWNQIRLARPECPLYEGITDGSYVYFVHSFHPVPVEEGVVATTTEYGRCFASSVWRGNMYATQFHPEKSQAVGLKLLGNFLRLAA
jgi:imidazole glycerol-phosphate synthase subunit HisH